MINTIWYMDKFQVNPNNAVIRWMMQIIQHYNHNKYWKYRKIVVSTDIKYPKWIKIFMLYYIKRCVNLQANSHTDYISFSSCLPMDWLFSCKWVCNRLTRTPNITHFFSNGFAPRPSAGSSRITSPSTWCLLIWCRALRVATESNTMEKS